MVGHTKDALRSMMFSEASGHGQPHIDMIKLLLQEGANPNYASAGMEPLSHLVVKMNIDAEPKLDLLRYLSDRGANFNLVGVHQGRRVRVLEAYWEAVSRHRSTRGHWQDTDSLSGEIAASTDTLDQWRAAREVQERVRMDLFSIEGLTFLFNHGAKITRRMYGSPGKPMLG